MMNSRPLVLVVHPEDHMRVSLYSILEPRGYAVATCERGSEALRYLAWARPSVVISDSHLPDMDGWEFFRQVRSGLAEIKRIVLIHSPEDLWRTRVADSYETVMLCSPLNRLELIRSVEGKTLRTGLRGDRRLALSTRASAGA